MGGLQKLFSVLINPLRRVSLSRSTRLYMLPLSTLRKRMFLPNPGFSSKITRNIHTQLSYTEDYGSTHGVSINSSTVNSSNILNQWQMLLNNLRTEGYFDRRDLDIQTNFQYDLLEHVPEDFARSVNACLLFAQERPHLLRLLPKNDVNNVVENGSLSLFKQNCDSLKRLKLFSASDDVHHIPESERAQTMDIMRLILTYMHNYLFSSQILESATSHNMGVSVHNLLNAMIHTSRPSQGLNFNEPIAGHVPNGWGQAPRTFRKNIEMKRGDWICPRCNFMNFARNMKCLECNEERPKTQLTDGDWMCPQCDFFNYGRNQSCVKCDCKKPYESSSGFGGSHDYKKSDESSVSGYSQKPQGEHASTGNSSIKTEIEKMLAANDEKAERWFSKISQMENVNDLSSAVDDEDFPEIMPMRKGVNRFVVSTRKTPLERRMANAQYRRNLGNGGSIEVNEPQLQAYGGKNSHINQINIDQCKGTDDNERNNNDNVNFVSFAPFPPNYFGKKNNALESNQMPESGISSSSLPEKSVNILTKVQSQQQDKGGLDSGLHGRELDKFTGISDLRENICERQNGGHNPSQFWPNDSTKDAGQSFSSSSPGVSNPLSSYESSDGKRWNARSRITSSQMQVSGELHDENSCNWNMSGTSSLQPNGALNDKKGWNSYSASGISNIHASNAPNDEENWNWNNKPGISRTQPSNAPNDGMSWNRNNGYEVSHPQSNMVPSNSESWKSEPSASSQRAENSFSTNERERWNSRIQNPSQFSPNNSGHTMGCWNNGSGISSPQPSNGPNDGVGWNWNNRSEISHPQSNMAPNNGDSWKSGPSPSSQILENSFFNNDSGRCNPGIQSPSQFPPNTNVHAMESWNNGPGISNPNASNGQSDGNSWNWSKGSDIQYPQSNTGQRSMQNWKSESATNSWTENNDKERWSNGSGIQYPKSNSGQNEVQNWNSESTTNSWANIANRKEWGNGSHIQNTRTLDANQSKHSGSQMKGTENDTGSWNNGFMGKSLEGSAVKKEPDPLDMSEEAKAERWFRRVAQIKDISELSQIPDEDFPQIMPMRKGVNRFVVSKRKTPLERRLTSPQYRRNLPIVSSTPGKDEN